MKKFKYSLMLIFIISLSLLLLSCSERYKEPAPFFDDLYLEYKLGSVRTIYNVEKIDNNHFKIIEKTPWEVFEDEIEEYFVDFYGKVYKSSFKDWEGGFSPIWIPAYAMEIGDTFDEGYQVIRKDTWKKWNVAVVKRQSLLGEAEFYYEINTGFWVGYFAKVPTLSRKEHTKVLVNTNADIPVAE